MGRGYGGVKDILKSGELRHSLAARRTHHLVRRPLRDLPPVFEHDHLFPQRKNFFPAMSDVDNRYAMFLVPRTQIIDDSGFSRRIQRS